MHTTDMAEKFQNTCGSTVSNASETNFIDWLGSSGLKKCAARFSANSYDDLDLIKTIDEDEIKEMIKNIRI